MVPDDHLRQMPVWLIFLRSRETGMPLYLYSDIYASGSLPHGWMPAQGGLLKYPVRNQAVLRVLRQLRSGRWRKVIKQGNLGDVHYFEHESGAVAGVKFFPRMTMR